MRLVPDLEASENKMADLDNFFAKKDKRKKGGKGFSKANTEIIAKNLEEIQRKELAAQEKEISMMENNLEKITNPLRKMLCSDDSEEWNDYREKVKDYSVLKIESVRLVSTDNEEQVSESHDAKVPAAESQEQGSAADLLDVNIDPFDEDEDKSEDTSLASSRRETPSPNPPRHQENEDGDSAGFKTVGKASSYVPPHLRVSQPPKELNVTTTGKSRRSKKVAPDINSEVYFPCLGVQDTLGSSREPSPVPSISPNSELKGAWEKKLEM